MQARNAPISSPISARSACVAADDARPVQSALEEVATFVGVLDAAIRERNAAIVAITVDPVGGEWRELGEQIPEAKDTSVTGGLRERGRPRAAVRELVLALRQIDMAASRGAFQTAAAAYANYRAQMG
jgi:hypothetical protein